MHTARALTAAITVTAAVWWAFGSGARRLPKRRVRLIRKGVTAVVLWWLPGPAVMVMSLVLLRDVAAAGSIGLVIGGAARVLRLNGDMRRVAAHTASISRFATLLANQATAAPTVPTAVTNAAQWASGSVEPAARNLAAGMESLGIRAACERFESEVVHPLGGALAATITAAHASGSEWASPLQALAKQADQTAGSVRLLQRSVGSKMPVMAGIGGLGIAILVGTAQFMPDLRPWYGTPAGQTTIILTGLIYAMFCYQILTKARKELAR